MNARNRRGKQSFCLPNQPCIVAWASIAGKKEAEGPLAHCIDQTSLDTYFGEKTWEQAEKRMQQLALQKLAEKAKCKPTDFSLVYSGDLLNQCIGSSFSLNRTGIPHLGLYGACSTMAESLGLAALFAEGGFVRYAAAVTSSHFCSAERQFRFPLEYGGQRTPSAQWTATAAGAVVVGAKEKPPSVPEYFMRSTRL